MRAWAGGMHVHMQTLCHLHYCCPIYLGAVWPN